MSKDPLKRATEIMEEVSHLGTDEAIALLAARVADLEDRRPLIDLETWFPFD